MDAGKTYHIMASWDLSHEGKPVLLHVHGLPPIKATRNWTP